MIVYLYKNKDGCEVFHQGLKVMIKKQISFCPSALRCCVEYFESTVFFMIKNVSLAVNRFH